MIVGLCGLAGSGKSTAAKYLSQKYIMSRRPLAYPLKAMLAALPGVDWRTLDGSKEVKEIPLEMFNGKTLRHAMQTLGTEWGRHQFGDDFWVNMWTQGIGEMDRIVCDDVRFPNEARMIRDKGGILIRIDRQVAGTTINVGHASEKIDLILPDHTINNDGLPEDLYFRLDSVLAEI